MRLNLRQIEAFHAVIETGSMTEAGNMLGISQPAVSRQIRDLEAQFGINLFKRYAGRVEPTKDAHTLHQEVERCLGGLEQLSKFASDLGQFRRQRLRITSIVGHSYFLLPKIIAEFHSLFPEVTISLHSCASPEVVELVEKGRSDIGLALLPRDVHGVLIEELPETNLVCVMPRDHALSNLEMITPTDLEGIPLLLISESSLMRKRLLQAFDEAEIKPNIIIESTYTGPICSLISSGMGVSIIDILTANAYSEQGIDIRPFKPNIPCELKLVLPATQVLSKPAKNFISILRKHAGEQLLPSGI